MLLLVVAPRPVGAEVADDIARRTTRPLVVEALGGFSPLLTGTEVEGAGYPAAYDAWAEAGEQLRLAVGERVSGERRVAGLLEAQVVLADELGLARQRSVETAARETVARARMIDVAVGAFMVSDAAARPQSGVGPGEEQDDQRRMLFVAGVEEQVIQAHRRAATEAQRSADAEADARVRLERAETELREAEAAFADADRRSDGWAEARIQREEVLPDLARNTRVAAIGLRTVVLDAYARASHHPAVTCGLPWNVLAGIGRVETRHGEHGGSSPDQRGQVSPRIVGIALDGNNNTMEIRDTDGGVHDGDTVYDRAVGPMQFIPSTWSRHGVDGNGDGFADPNNLYDAAASAAVYLCRSMPADGDLRRAILAYNRDSAYVEAVLGHASSYGVLPLPAVPAGAPG